MDRFQRHTFLKLMFVLTVVSQGGCSTQRSVGFPNSFGVEGRQDNKVVLDPDTHQASLSMYHYMVGQLAYGANDYQMALKNFSKVNELSPPGIPVVSAKLAELHLRSGELDSALRECDTALTSDPSNTSLLLMRAGILDALKRPSEAEPVYQKLIRDHPEMVDAHLLLASLYSGQGAYKKGIKVLQDLVKQSPREPSAHFFLGRLFEADGDLVSAERALREAHAIAPESIETSVELVRLLVRTKNYEAAKELCSDILDRDSTNVFARKILGQLLIGESRFDEALEHLQLLENVESDSTETRFKIALIQIGKQNMSEAQHELSLVLAAKPDHAEARYYLAAVLAGAGRVDEAITELLKVPSGELFTKSRLFAGVLLRQRGDLAGSEKILREALASTNDAESILAYLVVVLRDEKKFSEAEKLLAKELARNPGSEKLIFSRATVLHDLGRKSDAILEMEHLIEKNPRHGDALNYIAYQLAEDGVQLERATELAKRALEIRPKDGFYLDTLGWVYFKRGMSVEACETLERAAELERDLVIHEHFGDALIACGQAEKGIEVFRRAIKRIDSELQQGDKSSFDSEDQVVYKRLKSKVEKFEQDK